MKKILTISMVLFLTHLHPSYGAGRKKDWKTYTNKKYGFSIQYSSDFNVKAFLRNRDVSPEQWDGFTLESPVTGMSIEVYDKHGWGIDVEKATLEEFVRAFTDSDQIEELPSSPRTARDEEGCKEGWININKVSAYQRRCWHGKRGENDHINVFLERQDKKYVVVVSFYVPSPKKDTAASKFNRTFEAILHTFRWTEPKSQKANETQP